MSLPADLAAALARSDLVEDSLAAVQGRALNTMALAGLIGRGAMGWDGLLAETRYGAAQARLSGDVA